MPQGYTAQDVTSGLKVIMSLTGAYTVDPEGYWTGIDDKKRYEYAMDSSDQAKPIVLFQDPMPQGNYLFFNPFGEGAGRRSPAVQHFYALARIAANYRLELATMAMLENLLMTKKEADSGTTVNLSPAVARASAVMVDKKTSLFDIVDDTFLKEVSLLFSRLQAKLLEFPYKQNTQTAEVTSVPLKDEHFESKYGKDIRKKSLAAFKTAVQGVLAIVQPSDLDKIKVTYDPTEPSVPKFATLCRLYYLIYSRFNDLLIEFAETQSVNLGSLDEVISSFPKAHSVAKHASQPVPSRAKTPTVTQTTDTTSLDLSSTVTMGPSNRRAAIGPEVVGGSFSLNQSYQPQPTSQRSRALGPEVIGGPVDPYRSQGGQSGSYGMGGGYGYGQGYNFGQGGSSFGTQMSGYGNPNGILDLSAPSNFGSPAMGRRY